MNVTYEDLENKIVLVTGATRGIGNQIAKSLALNKAHVVFNYRSNPEAAEVLVRELKDLGAKNATALNFDISDFDKMKSEIDFFIKDNGPISGLVNNAGVSKDQLLLRVKPTDIDFIMDINLKATMVLTNHLSRNFLKAENVSIVNMSSIVGMMGNASQTVYSASKAGLIGYTKSYAKELASRKIRCNAISPGFIQTEMTDQIAEKAQDQYKKSIPMGDYGQTDDIANLTLFLLSGASSYITGEVIKVDGGLYI
jgi:3-oxoacyl-[acyl-carrier protein] reductase